MPSPKPFDLPDRDAIRKHLRRDPVLRPLIDQLDFPEERVQLREVYPALLRSVVGQQVSTAAARAIYARFLGLFDLDQSDPLAVPLPEVLAKADLEFLRTAGLSRAKAAYVQATGRYFADNPAAADQLAAMSDEEAIAELVQIKGVGRWTAEMMLMFALGRPDLLPLDDLAIYQSIIALYDLPPDDPKRALKVRMREIAEAWRPYRSWACLYLYAWRHSQRGVAQAL